MLLLIQIYYLIFFRWWSQIKTAGSAIYANRHYLQLYHKQKEERLAISGPDKPTIVGDVYIHPSATVDSTAVVSGHSAYYRSGVFKLWPAGHIQPATFFFIQLADNIQKPYKFQFYQSQPLKVEVCYIFGLL